MGKDHLKNKMLRFNNLALQLYAKILKILSKGEVHLRIVKLYQHTLFPVPLPTGG